MNPFFITGYPRSRTAWLANFLTTHESWCYHEGTLLAKSFDEYCRTLELLNRKEPCGDANSGLGFIYPVLLERFPKAKWVLIERQREHAELSFRCAFGQWETSEETHVKFQALTKLFAKLKPSCYVLDYESLNDLEVCRKLWFHLLPHCRFDEGRWRFLHPLRVEQFVDKCKTAYLESKNNPWFSELIRKLA